MQHKFNRRLRVTDEGIVRCIVNLTLACSTYHVWYYVALLSCPVPANLTTTFRLAAQRACLTSLCLSSLTPVHPNRHVCLQVVPALRDDPQALHLLSRLLTYDPRHRITAAQALDHPWFYDLKPSRSVLPGAVQLVQPQQQQQAQLSQQGSQVTVLQQAARQAAAAQQQQVQVQQQAALQAQAQQAALQQAALAAAMQQAAAASAYSGGTGTGTGTGTSTASVQQLPMMHAHMGLMGQAATAVAAVSGASC